MEKSAVPKRMEDVKEELHIDTQLIGAKSSATDRGVRFFVFSYWSMLNATFF